MRALLRMLTLLAVAGLAGCGAKEPTGIKSPEDVNRAEVRIGIMTGSTAEGLSKAQFPNAKLFLFDDIMDAMAALKANPVDVSITAYPQALQIGKTNADLTMLPQRLDHEPTAAAVRKGNAELLNEFNALVAELKSDGTLADMEKRWFKPDLSPYVEPSIEIPTDGEPLTIGVAATREPASFVDRDGKVTGFDGEMARRFGARLKRPIAFKDMKFAALIPALQSGKVDMIITGMSATPERAKFVDFSEPYFDNALMLVARKTAGGDAGKSAPGRALFTSTDDARGKRIGVVMGSAHETYLAKTWPETPMQQYQSVADMLMAVRTLKSDVGFSDTDTLLTALPPDGELIMFGPGQIPFDRGIGFRKGNTEMRDQFNVFLDTLDANGTLADMRKRWIDERSKAMPDLPPASSQGNPLVVGISDIGLPFNGLVNNRPAGFDIELMERFGRTIGRPIRFDGMMFGSLAPALASGKIDVIGISVYITPERKQNLELTRPDHVATSHFFALRTNIAGAEKVVAQKPGFWDRTVASFKANILTENRYLLLWEGLQTTVLISVLSTIFGTFLGAVVCAMRLSSNRLLNVPAKAYIGLLRGLPVLVLLMLIFYVVFASVDIPPVLVAVIAFGLNFGAYAAEIFRSGIEGVDKGQTEAGLAMGFTRAGTFVQVILPQMVRRVLPVYKGEFISMIKMTSIVGYIAVSDLTKASDIIRSRTFDAFFPLVMVAVLYFFIAWALVQLLGLIEIGIDPRSRRKAGAKP